VKNLKLYAREAGVGDVHLHQTRHSFARIVAEETGSLTDTQDALGHRNAATTRVYVQRIAIKRDKHSERITSRHEEAIVTTARRGSFAITEMVKNKSAQLTGLHANANRHNSLTSYLF